VTSGQITVAFPISNLARLASQLGFEGDVEYSEQAKAIRLFVNHINATGVSTVARSSDHHHLRPHQ